MSSKISSSSDNFDSYFSNNIKKTFGINLKKLRTSKNLTQEQLAEILNMQMQSITFIETGRTFVSSEILSKLCNYFKITLKLRLRQAFVYL